MPLAIIEHLRKAPMGFFGCLCLIVLSESYVARNSLRFSSVEHDDWRSARRAATTEIKSGGIVLFGDSQIKYGVSPLSVQSRAELPCQSLAIRGGQTPSSYFLLKRVLDSGIIPAAIVVDFEPNLLTLDRQCNKPVWSEIADVRQMLELAWPKREFDLFNENLFASYLPSMHDRFEIRNNIMTALRGETPQLAAHVEVVHRNRAINQGGILLARAPACQFDYSQWSNPTVGPWKPELVNEAFARRFLELARRHAIPVYCLLMPVAPGLQQKAESNGVEAGYLAWLKQFQEANSNLVILDWRHAGYDLPAFSDELHLNKEGAVSLGLALGDQLKIELSHRDDRPKWVHMPPFRLDGSENRLEDHMMSAMAIQERERQRAQAAADPRRIAVDPSRQTR